MRKFIQFVGFCGFLLLASAPTYAAAAGQCAPGTAPIEVLADFLNRNGVTEYFAVEDPERSMVVARVNGMVPATNWAPDSVVVYFKDEVGMLVFFIGDCVWSPGPTQLQRLEPLRPAQS